MSEAQRIRDQRRAKFLAKYNAKNGAKSNSSFSDSSYSNDFVHNRNGNPNTSNFNNNNQFTNQSNFQPNYQQSNLNQPNPNLQTPVLPKMDNKYNSFAEFEKSNAKISKAFDKINQQKEFLIYLNILKKILIISMVIMHSLGFPVIEHYKNFIWSFVIIEATGISLKFITLKNIKNAFPAEKSDDMSQNNDWLSIVGDFTSNFSFIDYFSQFYLVIRELAGDISMVMFINIGIIILTNIVN